MYAFICFLFVLFVFLIFYKIGWMGAGDVKLGAVLAFIFGFDNFLWVWVFSIIMLIIYSVLIKIIYKLGYEKIGFKLAGGSCDGKYIPYGAFLSISSMLLILKSEVAI